MLTAKKTWYTDNGDKAISTMSVSCAEDAFNVAHAVFRNKTTAYCITFDRWRNGAFVTRVMTKEKMIFKIEHHVA